MHDLQRTDICTLCQSFPNLKESMYNDQRKTFIQHVSDAKGSSIWSACTIGTERVVLCDSLLYLQRIFQDTSYVCKPGCFSGLVHKGRQLCSLLSTSCQSSGWFACPNIRLKCTCDRFSRFTETPGQLMCPAGKATYSPFHSFLQRYFKCRNSSSMLWTLMAAMHDLQRTVNCTLCQSFPNLKESMYNDQRKTFIQHVSDAKGSSIWSACTIGTERVVLCDSLLYLQRIFPRHELCW